MIHFSLIRQEISRQDALSRRARRRVAGLALAWALLLWQAAQSPMAAEDGREDITALLDTRAFVFKTDVGRLSLGAMLPSVAERMQASYFATPAAAAALKRRWEMSLKDALAVNSGGGTRAIPWSEIKTQLDAEGLRVLLSEVGGQQPMPGQEEVVGERSLRVQAAQEHLIVADSSQAFHVREALGKASINTAIPPQVYERAGVIVFEGTPAALEAVESRLARGALPGFRVLHGDAAGKLVLHYRLQHAWARQTFEVTAEGASDKTSVPGIEVALKDMLADYEKTPRSDPRDKTKKMKQGVATGSIVPPSTVRLQNALKQFRAPFQEPQMTGLELDFAGGSLAFGGSRRAQAGEQQPAEVAVPLRTETQTDSLATALIPVGAQPTLFLAQGGALVPAVVPGAAGTGTPGGATAQTLVENSLGSKMVALDAGPATTTKAHHEDAPDIRAATVVADHANNALMVICPAAGEAWEVHHLLGFLEQAITILDEPVSMVELSAAIIDINNVHAMEWGSRFVIGKSGDFNEHPALGRVGFDLSATGAGNLAGMLDPTAGFPRITAEAVAGQAISVGALLVGSSTKLLATLRALETDGHGRVLSRPSVVTLDGTEASVTESTSFYLPSSGVNSGSLTEVKVPLSIAALPEIVELEPAQGGKPARRGISLRLTLKDGDPSTNNGVKHGAITTNTIVVPGESLLVAGRTRDEELERDRHVPVLGRIPGLGRLFKDASSSTVKRQRLIMVTPTIVDTFSRSATSSGRRLIRATNISVPRPSMSPTATLKTMLAPAVVERAGAPPPGLVGAGAPATASLPLDGAPALPPAPLPPAGAGSATQPKVLYIMPLNNP